MDANASLIHSDLRLPGLRRGKVRDVYDLPADAWVDPTGKAKHGQGGTVMPAEHLLIVASDRISAFDVIMPTPIAGKGALLTRLSTFWLQKIEREGICATHLAGTDVRQLAERIFPPSQPRALFSDRIMIARKAQVVPIECVVRGYLEGSGWKEYQQTRSICGVALPAGLRQCDRLPEPIFTPATKEHLGAHDVNVSFEDAAQRVGRSTMERLRDLSLAIYRMASEHARARGIIIADTKFEFGMVRTSSGSDEIILVDEALTPDSSRFWPADAYAPGGPQRSFDKQFLREYLEELVARGTWNKQEPGPALPNRIARATLERYQQAHDRLTA